MSPAKCKCYACQIEQSSGDSRCTLFSDCPHG